MSDLSKLASQMKADWDRRIGHDYRFWMSDGYASDAAMWEAGARDFDVITKGLYPGSSTTIVDLGCGVGRLLKAALNNAGRVIGIDVSQKAIEKARSLLGANPRLELLLGNGTDLYPLVDDSVDLLISFATFGSIPAAVSAAYLRDIQRVLKPGGIARIQMYAGAAPSVQCEDTLNLRCYKAENIKAAMQLAGFEVQSLEELVLPLKVSFKELGFEAVIVSLKKPTKASVLQIADAPTIAQALLPGGEPQQIGAESLGKDLEYWMSVNYARELAERGELEKAKITLDYAASISQNTTIDVSEILRAINDKLKDGGYMSAPQPVRSTGQSPNQVAQVAADDFFSRNMQLLAQRFPAVAEQIKNFQSSLSSEDKVESKQTEQGPVFYFAGQCLDHPQKPLAGAESWAKKIAREDRFANCRHAIVVGCGAGYHLEAMLQQLASAGSDEKAGQRYLSLVEPEIQVFLQALRIRDCSAWLSRIAGIVLGAEAALPEMKGDDELWIRPQTQALAPQFCETLRSNFYSQRGLSLLYPTIGVVGPLAGGTQPMLEYVARALVMLGQRTHMYDLSGFNSGYLYLENFIKEKLRRGSIENTYCEMVSQVVLESINEKPIDILFCMALAPITPRVLLELRKRGIITVLWFVEDFARFTYWKDNARFYDFVFTIQKGKCIEAIREAGAGEVHYVPVACDPALHAPQMLSAEDKAKWGSPVSFMGAGYHNRQQIFASLAELPFKIWGTEWPTCRPFDRMVQDGGRRLTPAEYVKIFAGSDININLHSSHERDGVDPFGDFLNPRTFELASAGAFQLVDKRSLLSECFEEGKEIVTFNSAAELKQKIRYYLDRPEECRQIAERARKRALSEHTYQHRIKQMLSIIYSSKFEQLKTRLDNSHWQRMLKRAKPHEELYERCMRAFRRGEQPNLDGLVSDIVTGQGKLTETEQKLLFLFHVCKQIIRMKKEESGERS